MFTRFKVLLQAANLPVSDLGQDGQFLYLFTVDEAEAGTGGFEFHNNHALIRSVSVTNNTRSQGIGSEILSHLKDSARSMGATDFYLLTTNAAAFFERHGFTPINRSEAPEPIRKSTEFSSVCPASAVLMRCPA